MSIIGAGVSLQGIEHDDFHYPFRLASGITSADVGKAVALDTTAANTVKLAGDGDTVLGKLVSVENRVTEGLLVGTVALKGGFRFAKVGTINVGQTVVGSATAGSVKAATTADHSTNFVVESGTGYVVVVMG
jgi:hypothetical protein